MSVFSVYGKFYQTFFMALPTAHTSALRKHTKRSTTSVYYKYFKHQVVCCASNVKTINRRHQEQNESNLYEERILRKYLSPSISIYCVINFLQIEIDISHKQTICFPRSYPPLPFLSGVLKPCEALAFHPPKRRLLLTILSEGLHIDFDCVLDGMPQKFDRKYFKPVG